GVGVGNGLSVSPTVTTTYFGRYEDGAPCNFNTTCASVTITVNPVSVGGSVASAQTICSGTTPANLTLSGQTGSVVKWQKSSDAAFTLPTDIANTTTTLTGASIGALVSDTWFRAVVQ